GNIEIERVGLSSKSGDATLYIPVLNGLALTGWASLAPGNCPDTAEHFTKAVKVTTLDSYHLDRVSFIKIDVEGHELHVLRGAQRTLMESQPTVLVEIKEPNREAVFRFFSAINYVHQPIDKISGTASSEDYLFLPGK